MSAFTESIVEAAALEWFGAIGYAVLHRSTIAPSERACYAVEAVR